MLLASRSIKLSRDGLTVPNRLQDMEVRKRKRQLELLWRGSESLGSAAELFTGNFASGNYGPPPGFNWDWGQADPQMQVGTSSWPGSHENTLTCHPVFQHSDIGSAVCMSQPYKHPRGRRYCHTGFNKLWTC